MALDKSKSTIDYLRMEPADNGVIICYDVKTMSKGSKGQFDNCQYKSHKEVFDIDGENEDESIDKAFSRFKELWMKSYKEMKTSAIKTEAKAY